MDRITVSRLGGYSLAASHDPLEYTKKARATFLSQFEKDVDPDGVLDSKERARRAEAALKAHMIRLADLSAKKRRKARAT